MTDYREGCIYAKKVKAGIVEPKPVSGKSKRPTPVVLYALWRWFAGGKTEWVKIGAYRDEETARTTAAQHARKYSFYLKFRIGKDGKEFDPRASSLVSEPGGLNA